MSIRLRAGMALLTSLAVAMAPSAALAAGPGQGGGSGGESTGSVYADLVVALRAEDGTPILKKYVVPATDEAAETTEYCVQPVSYEPVPGVTATTNPLDGRQVWVLPLQGEWIGSTDPLPVEEIEPCDPKPQYAMFVAEAELERLNLARTSEQVIADKLTAVQNKLLAAQEIALDGAGRITTDGLSLDASPEFAAMYASLMTTGTIPGLPGSMAGPPAQIGIFDAWKLAAVAVGTAASKEVPITVDTIEYYNRVIGFPATADYTSPWGVDFLRSEDPGNVGSEMTTGERFVDYSGFTYNRADTFRGSVTWLDVPSMTWKVNRITDVVPFTQLTAEPIGTRTLSGVTAFAQLADDVRSVILYYHAHETIPGFFIDPVGIDTTAAQERAIHDPAVSLSAPQDAFQTEPFQVTAGLFNPWGGTQFDHARVRVTVDAAADLSPADVTVVSVADGQAVPFTADGGNLTGWWGPETGFPLPKGYQVTTSFDVTVAEGTPVGDYGLRLELVDLDTGATLAEDTGTVTVNDNVPTVLWGGEIYPLVTQGTPFTVPVTVYSPSSGAGELRVGLTGPGDDPATDLVEALANGDVTAYASDGTDMVAMPLTLDADGRLAGTWKLPLNPGYNPVTWYLTIADGALVGSYAIDVSLAGANAVEPAVISVAAPEAHGEQPPDAGEDTTAPVVTITTVGTLGSSASFTLTADEQDVTYRCRLVKDDVPGAWAPCQAEGTSYTGLTAGIYAFNVEATDAAGNVSGTYSRTWVVTQAPEDTASAPETRLVGGPANGSWVLARRVGFDVTSSAADATYIVTLNDRYAGTDDGGRVVVTGLRAGTNRVTIRALADGLADPTPLVRTVSVPRGVAGMTHTKGWTMRHGEGHLFGDYAQARRDGQVFRAYGSTIKRVALVVSKGADHGKVRVYLNGRAISPVISLSSAGPRSKVLVPVRTFASPRRGVVTVKVVGSGKVVRLEGIGITAR